MVVVPLNVLVGFVFTVTIMGIVGSDSPNVDIAILLYFVVAANPVGTSYVADMAPDIVLQVLNGLTELSHL